MGIRREFAGVAERIGSGSADFLDLASEQIRQFSCILWNNFPDQITQNRNLGVSFARGFMNNICSINGGTLPAPPNPPPFTGGQCPTNYYVVASFECEFWLWTNFVFESQGIVYPSVNTSGQTPIVGPIQSIEVLSVPPCPSNDPNQSTCTYGGRDANLKVVDAVGEKFYLMAIYNGGPFTGQVITPSNRNFLRRDTFANISIQVFTVSGDPDTCGDAPPTYPPTSPTVNDYTTIINIDSGDGDSLSIPLTYAPVNFNFPLNFNLGGITVEVDLGGINFNFGPGGVGGGGGTLEDGQEAPLPVPGDDPGGGKNSKKFPPINLFDFIEIILPPAEEEDKEVNDVLDYVTLELVEFPLNPKTQIWAGGKKVYYCGWFSFKSGTFVYKREPVHFDKTIWRAPDGATGYTYQLYPGYKAETREYYRKEDKNGS